MAAFLVLAGCNPATEQAQADNSWTEENLKGKVSRILEVRYNAVNDRGTWRKDKQQQIYSVKTYNAQGYLTSERAFYSDTNQPAGGNNRIYDENNNLLRIEQGDQQGGVVSYSDVSSREGKVRILEYSDYYGTGDEAILTGKTKMTWDGYKIKSAVTEDPYGETISTSEYTYNEKGNLATFDVTTKKPQERYIKMKSEYANDDEKGNWTVMFVQYENLPNKEFVERQIEYFKD